MQHFFLAQLLLAVAVVATAIEKPPAAVVVRQTTPAPPTIMSCPEYSRIANLSTIGKNSTYRATFFAASPNGNHYNAEVLDNAILQLPAVILNQALNEACGNLTALAIVEAERNFTQRTVAQFSDIPLPEPLKTGPLIAIVCGSVAMFMGVTWVAMP
ncbi:hypothetical protein CTRI78_v006666 [Colletotrichum trifolii]|uniref:Uncharacterized protein n=1 Tax=Colletotrichum trifolii TaxID=5466 RepID=A0A4R8RGI0_COLTR|nr:hypothetical protein CTRI78_v006666 [Colletotrichum trifolii]